MCGKVPFVSRTANVASHKLAQFVSKLVNNIDWVDNFPNWLIEAVMKDMRAIALFCN